MKKRYKAISIIIVVVITYFLTINIINSIFCKAYLDRENFVVQYNGKIYYQYSDLFDYTVLTGEPSNITGVLSNSFSDYFIFPREYVYHIDEIEDINTNFIVYESITTIVFVEENFKMPNIKDNIVEAIWFS